MTDQSLEAMRDQQAKRKQEANQRVNRWAESRATPTYEDLWRLSESARIEAEADLTRALDGWDTAQARVKELEAELTRATKLSSLDEAINVIARRRRGR